ncbi:MAG: ABC transporter ATP-binding protein [Rhodospirillales bacterium]|nr:ABC transporter ATP-binding protein [Rhodospirillales bacterium]MXX23383.1 ABC transporter ATP-binding protein [Rhodospirillales bacterium]MYE19150.1 ABC transporter ATP-binding protein [Rhodospirillales bacterium]
MNPAALLEVEHLTMRFGGLVAVDDVSFSVAQGAIHALIGPNGAGKTTVFNCLTGFYKPSVGRITLNSPESQATFLLEQMDDFRIVRDARVVRTFQNIRTFPKMSVLENLMVAQHNHLMRASGWTFLGLIGAPSFLDAEAASVERAEYWIDRTGLAEYADSEAGALPYGEQRRLEIARAMCCDPVLLCLDEPAAGLNPSETEQLSELIGYIRDHHHISVLLIEHDMSMVMGVSDHIVVLDYGQKIAEGTPEEVRNDPAVVQAYLGSDDDDDADAST